MRKLLVITGLLAYLGLATVPVVRAADSEARLEVAPLSCLFEQVDDGSSDLVYLSPAECGQAGIEVPMDVVDSPSLPAGAALVPQLVPFTPAARSVHVKPETDSRNTVNPLVRMARAGQAFVSNPAYSSVTAIVLAPAVITVAVPTLRFKVLRRLAWLKNLILPKS